MCHSGALVCSTPVWAPVSANTRMHGGECASPRAARQRGSGTLERREIREAARSTPSLRDQASSQRSERKRNRLIRRAWNKMAPRRLCSCSCGPPVHASYVRRGQALHFGEVHLARKVACAARLAKEKPHLRPTLLALLASGPCKGHGCAPRRRALAAANGQEGPQELLQGASPAAPPAGP